MDQNNENGQIAGESGVASPGIPASGNQGGDTTPQGTSQDQNSPQPDSRNEETERLRKEVKLLNKAVLDARRSGRQNNLPNGSTEGNPFDSEAGQYAAGLELADARLRGNLEERIA